MKYLSSSLLLAILTLLGVGVVQVYSSSFILATENYGDGLFFFKRQLLFAVVGFLVMLGTIHMPFRWIEKWSWLTWPVGTLALFLIFIPGVGVRVGGALRWIQLPFGFRLEPAEMMKIAFVLFFTTLLHRKQNQLKDYPLWALLLTLVLPFVLFLKQPDFGTFALITMVGFSLLFAFGLQWRYIIAFLSLAAPAFYFLVMSVPYRRARVLAFLDPWADPEHKGFQVIQSMLSFHSGGITGAGLGQGQGKLFFLPEAHTDFTLAVFGEEMGFLGFLVLLSLYGFVVFKSFQIAFRCNHSFKKMLALGFGLIFSFSIFINMGVVLGILPTKGLTLPFLSYGGSSLIGFCILFGLLINIEKNLNEHPFQ